MMEIIQLMYLLINTFRLVINFGWDEDRLCVQNAHFNKMKLGDSLTNRMSKIR